MKAKPRNFVVTLDKTGPDDMCGIGPFVVQARSPAGAFRIVRSRYAHMITNHVSRESRTLSCEGITSDRRGYLRIGR